MDAGQPVPPAAGQSPSGTRKLGWHPAPKSRGMGVCLSARPAWQKIEVVQSLGAAYPVYLGAAVGTCAPDCRAAILHGYALGIFYLPLVPTLYAVCFNHSYDMDPMSY